MPDQLEDYPYVVVRISCTLCTRRGQYRLARLAERYGAKIDMRALLEFLAGDCEYRGRPRHPIRPSCGARFADLFSPQPPPDMPPSRRLRIVKTQGVEDQNDEPIPDESATVPVRPMPISKCSKCSGTQFEVVEAAVRGADRPLSFVQCAGCGTVVSAIEAGVPAADTKTKSKPQQR